MGHGALDSPQKLGTRWYRGCGRGASAVAKMFHVTASLILSIVSLEVSLLKVTFLVMFRFILMAIVAHV